jgi:hypothetical protein
MADDATALVAAAIEILHGEEPFYREARLMPGVPAILSAPDDLRRG